jgi:threonine/homoserine/homoserine lactone efflux protein
VPVVDASAAAGMALLALGLVLTPGPNMLYLVSRSLTQGRRAGLVSLVGTGLGFLVYLAAAALGISAVFVAVPAAYTALKLAGAVYLLWLAWSVLRPGARPVFELRELERDPPLRLVGMGFAAASRCSRSSSARSRSPSRSPSTASSSSSPGRWRSCCRATPQSSARSAG